MSSGAAVFGSQKMSLIRRFLRSVARGEEDDCTATRSGGGKTVVSISSGRQPLPWYSHHPPLLWEQEDGGHPSAHHHAQINDDAARSTTTARSLPLCLLLSSQHPPIAERSLAPPPGMAGDDAGRRGGGRPIMASCITTIVRACLVAISHSIATRHARTMVVVQPATTMVHLLPPSYLQLFTVIKYYLKSESYLKSVLLIPPLIPVVSAGGVKIIE